MPKPRPVPQQPQSRSVPQRPQATPQAPPPQKPQAPAPPVAPKAPPGKIERERKIMKLSYARRARILHYLLGFILLGIGGYLYLFNPMELRIITSFISIVYITAAFAFLGIIVLLYTETKRRTADYYITQYRIVETLGILRKKEHGLQLSLVESVRIRQGFFNRILGIGDVEVKTSRDSITLHRVGNPEKAESLILSQLNKIKGMQGGQ